MSKVWIQFEDEPADRNGAKVARQMSHVTGSRAVGQSLTVLDKNQVEHTGVVVDNFTAQRRRVVVLRRHNHES